MEFGTFWPPEVTHYFGDKHTHDLDHAECHICQLVGSCELSTINLLVLLPLKISFILMLIEFSCKHLV